MLLGANGSGKSTIFDVFNFLSECFTVGLRKAWDSRGRFRELRTRGAKWNIAFELQYRETPESQPATYHLEIGEGPSGPVVAEEWLKWRRVAAGGGAPFKILSFSNGRGYVISGEQPERSDTKVRERLDEPEMLAVSTLGRLAKNPRVAALRRFVTNWYVSYLSVDDARSQPEAGAQERLSKTGDNLANVVQYLSEQHPARLNAIFETLRRRIPRLERVLSEPMPDGRLLLRLKDAPFADPVLARFASDGTLKMLAYLVVLQDPHPPQFIGVEEPEIFCTPGCFQNSPKSAGPLRSVRNCSSPPIRRSSSTRCGPKRFGCSTAMPRATPRQFASRTSREFLSSSRRVRAWANCGWRAASALVTRWSAQAHPRGTVLEGHRR